MVVVTQLFVTSASLPGRMKTQVRPGRVRLAGRARWCCAAPGAAAPGAVVGWCWAGGEGAPWRALLGYPPGTVTLAACCCCFWRGMCAADRVPAVQAGAAAAPTATAAPAAFPAAAVAAAVAAMAAAAAFAPAVTASAAAVAGATPAVADRSAGGGCRTRGHAQRGLPDLVLLL